MRILALADLHGDHRLYRWLAEQSVLHAPDTIVLAGDLLGCPDGFATAEEAQRFDAERILEILGGVVPPIFYVMGNDDLVELESKAYSILSVHNQRIEFESVNFVGYQYSLPFMGGVFEKSDDQIRQDLRTIESLVDEHTILVTHSPAYGIMDVGVLGVSAGSESIRELVDRRHPLFHIHGHIHQGFGRFGRHFNVAAAGTLRAVQIDTVTKDYVVLESTTK